MKFQKGNLREEIARASQHALSVGALIPINTDYTFIDDGGIRFFVRIQTGLRKKDEERNNQESGKGGGRSINPFLPPEKDLLIGDVSDTHIAVLNKFNVVDDHLLIITRHFEEQQMLLTLHDFEALWSCMVEFSSLGFYNGGPEAGASQPHKHLQLVPLPLAPEGPEVPIEPLLPAARDANSIPGFPFPHAFAYLPSELSTEPGRAAQASFTMYSELLIRLKMDAPSPANATRQSLPYCFLITRNWMLIVPRTREFVEDISFNSLAFAGSLFIRNEQQLARLRTIGPMNALIAVTR